MTPDVILGHPFLDMHRVIINYAHDLFLGKDKWLKFAWCDSSIKKEITTTNLALDHLQIFKLLGQRRGDEARLHSYSEVITDKIGYTTTHEHRINLKTIHP